MIKLSEINRKTVIDTETGRFLGNAVDFDIDIAMGQIKNLVIPGKGSFFRKRNDLLISWKAIKKIGAEIILAETEREPCSDIQTTYPF